MKNRLLSLLALTFAVACSSPCDNDASLAKFAHESAAKLFPVPASVNFALDSVYTRNGNEIARGRVTYTNAMGQGVGPVKYWVGINCAEGEPVLKFVDVDHGGPKWGTLD